MSGSQFTILITIVVYLLAMVLIGVYFGKKGSGKSSDDFYLGGRKMETTVESTGRFIKFVNDIIYLFSLYLKLYITSCRP